jgi:holo-[acyl-carrier protein] synthase
VNIFCGVDMVEIKRIQNSVGKLGKSFVEKVFTSQEIEYCEGKRSQRYQSYAARFAAKEAVSKALGTGISKGVSLKTIEVTVSESGKPNVVLHDGAKEVFEKMGGVSMDISLTHTQEYAAAFVVLLCTE